MTFRIGERSSREHPVPYRLPQFDVVEWERQIRAEAERQRQLQRRPGREPEKAEE